MSQRPNLNGRYVTINLSPEFYTGEDSVYRVVTGFLAMDGNAVKVIPTLWWRTDDGDILVTTEFTRHVAMGVPSYEVRDDEWVENEVDDELTEFAIAHLPEG